MIKLKHRTSIASNIKHQYGLTPIQTAIYNSLSTGEFYFRNGDAQLFHDPAHKGIGWGTDRTWVEHQLKPLIKAGVVVKTISRAPRDARYTVWTFHDARFKLRDLINLSNFAFVYQYAACRHVLNLPAAFYTRELSNSIIDINSLSDGHRTYDFRLKEYDYYSSQCTLQTYILDLYKHISMIYGRSYVSTISNFKDYNYI